MASDTVAIDGESETCVLSREDCTAIAKEHFGLSDVEVEGWQETRLGGDKPLGLLGAHLKAVVDVWWAGKPPRRERLSLFVKTLPQNHQHASFVEDSGAALKEFLYYAELEPAMRAALSSERHGPRPPAAWGCRCLLARRGVLALEDLGEQGFVSHGARYEPSLAHASLVARALAALHAHSLAFERTRDAQLGRCFRLDASFPDIFRETFYVRAEGTRGRFTSQGVMALEACAQLLPMCQADPAIAQRVRERLPGVLWRICDAVKPSRKHRNVFIHGDLWLNNILFRYDKVTGLPVDARLVDYQLARYCPPAFELLQFLHVTCRRTFRQRHEVDLLKEYYAHLQEQLACLGLSIEQQLPWTAFESSWEDARFNARVQAPFFLHIIAMDESTLGKAFATVEGYRHLLFEGRKERVLEQFQSDAAYRELLSESLEELLREHVLVEVAAG